MTDNPAKQTPLPDELREKLQRAERPAAWELALGVGAGAMVLAAIVSLFRSAGPLQLRLEAPGALLFGCLAILLMLAWFAAERARRAHLHELEFFAEMLQRHVSGERALRDPLTGAYNRGALQELWDRYANRALRTDRPLALIVLDLDHFHELNSNFGHLAGDIALADFAHVLHSSTRGSDVVARYGGDEFVLLLSETPSVGAEVVIKRITERVAARNAQLSGKQIPLSFTAGAAELEKGSTFSDVFREADVDLLNRKAARPEAAEAGRRR